MRRAAIQMLTVVSLGATVAAQEADRYLLLATTATGTMQREIDEAAGRGYRVRAASRTEGAEVIVALEKTEERYRYRLVATTRTGTLQRELTEAAEAGYRVVSGAVTTKRSLGNVLSGPESRNEGELLIIMEKGPEAIPGLAYQVLAANRTGTLQKEMSQLAGRGYTLVALSSRGEHVAIFERHD
ncbi:MAG: hypothetical protein AB7H93_03505 [Vicinamibacterales bacterium]